MFFTVKLETEIRTLTPEGGKIDSAKLARATIATNTILRRKQGISAYEIYASQSQNTGANIHLDDKKTTYGATQHNKIVSRQESSSKHKNQVK